VSPARDEKQADDGAGPPACGKIHGPLRDASAQRARSFSRTPTRAGAQLRPPPWSRRPTSAPASSQPTGRQPKLLDRLREALRSRHYSHRTEQCYCHWVKRFNFFHHVRHPAEMGEPEVNAFLTSLAMKGKVSASTQNQALSALLFLYRYVLDRPLGQLARSSGHANPTVCRWS